MKSRMRELDAGDGRSSQRSRRGEQGMCHDFGNRPMYPLPSADGSPRGFQPCRSTPDRPHPARTRSPRPLRRTLARWCSWAVARAPSTAGAVGAGPHPGHPTPIRPHRHCFAGCSAPRPGPYAAFPSRAARPGADRDGRLLAQPALAAARLPAEARLVCAQPPGGGLDAGRACSATAPRRQSALVDTLHRVIDLAAPSNAPAFAGVAGRAG